jgi:uncharacterized protein YcbX
MQAGNKSVHPIPIGHIEALYRYPVKSMRGESVEAINLSWNGLEGDRRFAFRRMHDRSPFPWLTAGKLPELLLFTPRRLEENAPAHAPTHVTTPDGRTLPVFGDELAEDIARRHGTPVEMTQFKNGIFDDATVSVIATDTVQEIGRQSGKSADVRRFRPNVLVRLLRPAPFQEDEWVGGTLTFGEGDTAPAVAVTMPDLRCAMVNFEPDSAESAPEVMKAIARANQANAGIYATVTRTGRLAVGQGLYFSPPALNGS